MRVSSMSRVNTRPGLRGQRDEDLELDEGRLHRLAARRRRRAWPGRCAARGPRSGSLAVARLAPGHARAPQRRLHAGAELAQRERLGDVVVGAELEAEDLVDLLGLGREHDDRHRRARAQAPAHLEPVDAGHHHVEHDEVERSSRRSARAPRGRRWPARPRSRPCAAGSESSVWIDCSSSTSRMRGVCSSMRLGQGTPSYPADFACSTRGSTAPRSIPVLFALIVARVLAAGPSRGPSGRRSQPDAFDGVARARPTSTRAAARLPDAARRATAATRRSAAHVAASLPRDRAPTRSATPSLRGRDGRRQAPPDTVIARQVGQPGPGLVVVAHRDAPGRGAPRRAVGHRGDARARARGRAAGACSARVTFVSTSGGSAGLRRRARPRRARCRRARDAVLVLGDLAGDDACAGRSSRGWSTGDGVGVAAAAAHRRGRRARGGGHRPGRRARDVAVGAPRLPGHGRRAGAARAPPACRPSLLSVGGERPPAGRRPDLRRRGCRRFGRAALRTLTALDNAPDARAGGSTRALVTMRKVLPAVGGAAARRRAAAARRCSWRSTASRACAAATSRSARGCGWIARRGARRSPLALAFAWLLGVTGLLPATPPEPVAAGRDPGAGPPGPSAPRGHRARRRSWAGRAAAARCCARRRRARAASAAAARAPRCSSPGARWPPCCGCATPTPRRCSSRPRTCCSPSSPPSVRLRRGLAVGARRASPPRRSCSSPVDRRPARARRRSTSAGSACCSSPAASSGRSALGHLEPRCSPAWSPRCSWRCAAARA